MTKKKTLRKSGKSSKGINSAAQRKRPVNHKRAGSRKHALVAVIMGSKSDWETMKHTDETLTQFGVPHECKVISAHRTPKLTSKFTSEVEARGIKVIIAGAGGAAHLAGVVSSQTILPVLGVPVESRSLKGLDSLLSVVQMPAGIPTGTLAIGKPGAINAALLAVAILANNDASLQARLRRFRKVLESKVLKERLP